MSATKTILETPLFRIAVGLPAFLFIHLAGTVLVQDAWYLECQWDSQGFLKFLALYKLPLSVLACAVPLGGLAALQHHSKQRGALIQLQAERNVKENYDSHRAEFERYIDRHFPNSNFHTAFLNQNGIYHLLYANSINGDLIPPTTFIETCKQRSEFLKTVLLRGNQSKLTKKEADEEFSLFFQTMQPSFSGRMPLDPDRDVARNIAQKLGGTTEFDPLLKPLRSYCELIASLENRYHTLPEDNAN